MDYKAPQPSQSIFLIEVDKIKPNPLQPRKEFDQYALQGLAESVRQYGVLQPLVVVRRENISEDGAAVSYELIAGERRLRAAQMAGLKHVPVIIREEPSDRVKLELALIENIQRKDLNPVERARAFKQLMDEFSLRHSDVGRLVGKSREWVSNSVRVLALPQDMQDAIADGRISEGHGRPLLMLTKHPEQQRRMFSDIIYRNISTRDAELGARRIAVERARKRDGIPDPVTQTLESRLSEVLGTRVVIERKGLGGKLSIEFFSEDDLRKLFSYMQYRPGVIAPVLASMAAAAVAQTAPQEEPVLSETNESAQIDPPVPVADITDEEEEEISALKAPESPGTQEPPRELPQETPLRQDNQQYAQEEATPPQPAPSAGGHSPFPVGPPEGAAVAYIDELPPSLRLSAEESEREVSGAPAEARREEEMSAEERDSASPQQFTV